MTASFMRYPFGAPVEVARNLVPNPTIELGTLTYVPETGTPTLTRSAVAGSWVGNWALRVRLAANGTCDVGIGSSFITITAGTQYTFSFYVRSGATARSITAGLRFYDAAAAQVGSTVLGTAVTSTTTGWTRVTVTATAGAGAVSASPLMRISSGANTESHSFDGMMMNAGATAGTFFDGSFPAAPPVYYRWVGVPHMSASVAETAGTSDTISPDMGTLTPYSVQSEARSVARPLLESSEIRAVLVDPGPRSGVLSVLYYDPADAMTAFAFFRTGAKFKVTDRAYASMWFVVSGGSVEFNQSPIGYGIVRVPFVEVSSP